MSEEHSVLHPALLALPFMVLVAVADVVAGPTVGLLALFSLGPAFASVAGTARRAVLIGVTACVLCAGAAAYDGLSGSGGAMCVIVLTLVRRYAKVVGCVRVG